MDRTAAIAAIKATMPNIDQTVLDGMTDDQLVALASNLPAASAPADAMMADAPATREELIAVLVSLGQDAAALEGMDDAALQAKWLELTGGQVSMSDAGGGASRGTVIAPAPVRPTPAGNGGRQPQKVTLQFAERQAQQTLARTQALNAKLTAEERKVADRLVELKRKEVSKFCEQLVGEGRIRPVDVAVYSLALMSMDDEKATHKFSESGKTEMVTPFIAKQRELLKLPVVIKFGEKLGGKPGQVDDSIETERVRRFAESDIMAPALKAAGKKPEQYVHSFSERRKKDPTYTAAKHGVPEEYCV